MVGSIEPEALEAEIARLRGLGLPELRAVWEQHYGTAVPRTIRRDLLVRSIAWRIQAKALGGIKPATRKYLRQVAEAARSGPPYLSLPWPHQARHQADPGLAGRDPYRDGAGRWLRMAGPAPSVPVRDRSGHHRHPVEWAGVLRVEADGLGFQGLRFRTGQPDERKSADALSGTRVRTLRCAIYTRKSSEEGLEQEFNSLDAQREACEAYIASQKHEGWKAVPSRL